MDHHDGHITFNLIVTIIDRDLYQTFKVERCSNKQDSLQNMEGSRVHMSKMNVNQCLLPNLALQLTAKTLHLLYQAMPLGKIMVYLRSKDIEYRGKVLNRITWSD